jgi:hypothetical protein
MATIHHATVKSAAAKGVILTLGEGMVTAHRPEPNRRVEMHIDYEGDEPTQQEATERAKDAWVALTDILAYEAEHPGVRIETEDGDFVGYGKDREEIARDPDLADLFESLDEAAGQEVEGEDDGEEDRGSVVPAKYKKLYAERGDPNHCGDWLAGTLAGLCRVLNEHGKETTDLDRLETIAAANDVEPARYGKLGIATNGWQGRYRMTIRNMLTPRVAAKGFLFVPEGCGSDSDAELRAPREWCEAHSPKVKAKADPKAAVKKNEGAGKASAKTQAKKKDPLAGVKAATAAVKASRAKKAAKHTGM